jgi:hypothetical protein
MPYWTSADTGSMAARGERLASDIEIGSPELALVDPELRERARLHLEVPNEQPPATTRQRSRSYPLLRASPAVLDPLDDDEASKAVRRLAELAEVEPTAGPKRSTTLLSLAFAMLTWGTLALVVADLQPWRA